MTVGSLPSRDQALSLLHEWIENPNLRKHCYAVEASMRAYARKLGEDEECWGLTGLIHDFDWERHPDAQRHPMQGVEVLRANAPLKPEVAVKMSAVPSDLASSCSLRAAETVARRACTNTITWWPSRTSLVILSWVARSRFVFEIVEPALPLTPMKCFSKGTGRNASPK